MFTEKLAKDIPWCIETIEVMHHIMCDNGTAFLPRISRFFRRPQCGGDLTFDHESFHCSNCHALVRFAGIPLLFSPNEWDPSEDDVTDRIKSFYERHRFLTTMT